MNKETEVIDRHCEHCGTLVCEGKTGYRVELYNSPFDDIPRVVLVHSDPRITEAIMRTGNYDSYGQDCYEYLFDQSWGDFRYFECMECCRLVCRQSPSNGWHVQVREMEDGEVCLQCYEIMILRDGLPREGFENGTIGGMFFSGDNREPYDAGYTIVEGFNDYHVGNSEAVCSKAIELINSGYQVVIGFERMAIGGLEGYITMFYKKEVKNGQPHESPLRTSLYNRF